MCCLRISTETVTPTAFRLRLDYDRDGNLDLFVTNYVDFTVLNHNACYGVEGKRDYCNPAVYRPVPDRLFRNTGGGGFEDVSESVVWPNGRRERWDRIDLDADTRLREGAGRPWPTGSDD